MFYKEAMKRVSESVYTLGKRSIYEHLGENPKKAKGGSVWRTKPEAEKYRAAENLDDFDVYEVKADWGKDVAEGEGGIGTLKKNATLVIKESD